MSRKILILKTGNTIPSLLQRGQDFEHWFIKSIGLAADKFQLVSVFLNQALPPLDEVEAIVSTGSPAYVTDLAPWNFVVAAYLREAFDRDIPQLGVCYGHQLLAWAFGGEVGFHPLGREIGTVPIRLSAAAAADPLFRGSPAQFQVQVSHQQTVMELPPGAVLLAANEFEPHHAFRLGDCAWGVQFHPEFDASIMDSYIRERRSALTAEGLDPETLLAQTRETAHAASLLHRFRELIGR
ncbi:MAG: glutamine amidotransferase [Gammaproteobacteria bacterium]